MGQGNAMGVDMATVRELEEMLEQARLEEEVRDSERRQEQSRLWAAMYADPDSWEWESFPQRRKAFFRRELDLDETRVVRKLKASRLEQWKLGGPGMFSSNWEDGKARGMFYYRTDEGILTGSGGGYHVLDIPRLCSDAEWAEILAGRIPMKFRLHG